MATPRQRAIDTVNAIRANSSEAYQKAIPKFEQGADYTASMQTIVQYTPFYNEFVSGLVNRIMFTQIESKMFNNPLSIFHRGGNPLGTDVQDIYINPANPKAYNMNSGAAGLFEDAPADVKVQYFRRNRQDKYKITIPREVLAGGFNSWEQLDNFIQKCINSVYSGNVIDEYNLAKKTFAEAAKAGALTTQDIAWTDNNADASRALALQLRTLYGKFKFPGSDYNKYQAYATASGVTGATPAITWVENGDVVLLIKSEVNTAIDMFVEAVAYNLDRSDLLGRVIEVDNFNYFAGTPNAYVRGPQNTDMDDCLAIICDRKAVQVWNNLTMAGDFFNPDDLKHHYYNHVWQTYGFNTCANAVAIGKSGFSASITG